MIITRKIEIFVNVNGNEKEELNEKYKFIRDISYSSYQLANEISSDLYMNLRLLNQLKNIEGLSKDTIDKTKETVKSAVDKSKKTKEEKELNLDINKEIDKVLKNKVYEYIASIYGSNSTQNIPYKISDKYKDTIPSAIRSCLCQNISGQFKSDIKDIMRGDRSLRNYRREGFPIYFAPRKEHFVVTEKGKGIELNWINKTKFVLNFGRDRSNNKFIVNQIIEGKYKVCGSTIQYKKSRKKWFLNLVVELPKIENTLDYELSVGVDVGLSTLAYCALSKGKSRAALGNMTENIDNYVKKRQRMQKQRKTLQRELKIAVGSKGRNKKLKALERYENKEKNYVKTINHKVSREIIKFALSNKAGVIKLEDLSRIDKTTNRNEWISRNWTYFELQKFIEYKAKMNGINIAYVDPKNTTKTCSSCGNIKDKMSLSERTYKCECGFEENRDYNAAINIARRTDVK